MGLNSSKLDAIRLKLSTQTTASTTTTEAKVILSANQQSAAQVTKPEEAGKAIINSGLVSLQAKAAAISPTSSSQQESQASAGTINFQRVADSIEELKQAIHGAHPTMPRLLHSIWETLHSYPEQVTLLSEEQMETVFSGLEKIVDTDLANITIKAATKSGGKKAPVTTASLGF